MVAFLSQMIAFVVATYNVIHVENISSSIMKIVDIVNCMFFVIIYIAMGCMFKKNSQNKYFLFLLAFLQFCFIILLVFVYRNSPAGKIGYMSASFTNFIIEFYIGINLFKLEDNRHVKFWISLVC